MNASRPRFAMKVLRYHVDECTNTTGERPCPNMECRFALAVDHAIGADESCSLDVAGNGDHTEQRVGELLGVTRQAVALMLQSILRKVRRRIKTIGRPAAKPTEPVIPKVRIAFCGWCANALPVDPKSADGRRQKRRRFCSAQCAKNHNVLAKRALAGTLSSRAYANKAVALMAAKDRAVGE